MLTILITIPPQKAGQKPLTIKLVSKRALAAEAEKYKSQALMMRFMSPNVMIMHPNETSLMNEPKVALMSPRTAPTTNIGSQALAPTTSMPGTTSTATATAMAVVSQRIKKFIGALLYNEIYPVA